MDIKGKITGIKYKISISETLKVIDIQDFNINESPAFCLVKDEANSFAVSKWVSPKRTRSYPYERVYNTLNSSKKITVIPIVKDEGAKGDRDFIQWDTVSLMSLLGVFVIFAYHEKAEINPRFENKITNQQFENEYIILKIKEIEQYHSSALHWNLNELKNNLHQIIDKAKTYYSAIENNLGIKLHNFNGIDNFREQIGKEVESFMQFSREKAEKAQTREMLTTQPKESLSTLTKAKITITNYLGGQYFFTVDEILIENNIVYLIESKHSTNSILPSKGDIKDGLLKMILYSNLSEVEVDGVNMKCKAVLKLTSSKLKGEISSESRIFDRVQFIAENDFKPEIQVFISELFKEAEENGFEVRIELQEQKKDFIDKKIKHACWYAIFIVLIFILLFINHLHANILPTIWASLIAFTLFVMGFVIARFINHSNILNAFYKNKAMEKYQKKFSNQVSKTKC